MSAFGSSSLFGFAGGAAQQQQQKPLQQTGGLFGGAAATGGVGIGSGSVSFGQPTAAAAAPGSTSTSLFSSTPGSSRTGLFQGSLFGGGGSSGTGAAAATAALPSSSLFGGTSAPGSLFSAAGTAGLGGPATAAGLLGQQQSTTPASTMTPTRTAAGLLGGLPTAATGLSTAPGLFTTGLGAAAGAGGGGGGAVPGVVGWLPILQQQYLATVDARVQRVESMLADETASMATFVYQYEGKDHRSGTETAAGAIAAAGGRALQLTPQQHNEAMEAQLQQLLLLQPGDAGVRLLLRKWKKAIEENPDPKNCRIVLIQGTKQLAERVAAAAQLTQLLLKTLETVGNNTDQLLSRNRELMEKAAFPWEEWQRRLDLLRVWTAALNRSAAAASCREGEATTAVRAARRRPASGADEGGKGWLAQLQEEAEDDNLKDVARVLAAQGEALEELNLSLAYSEQQTELIEDATVRSLKEGQDEGCFTAAAGGVAAVPAKKGLL